MKRLVLTVFLSLTLAFPVLCQVRPEAVIPPQENAAFDYLTALAQRPIPGNVVLLEAEYLSDSIFSTALPPSVLDEAPDLLTLLKLMEYDRAVRFLHQSAAKPKCQFGIDMSKYPAVDLSVLAPLRQMAKKTFLVALACERDADNLGAAEIYADLVTMGDHIAQEHVLIAGMTGVAIQRIAMEGTEGLLARSPSRDAAACIEQRLSTLPPWAPRLASACQSEAVAYGLWLQANPAEPLVSSLTNLPADATPEQRAACVAAAAGIYRDQTERWSKLLSQPYWQAREALVNEEARVDELIGKAAADPAQFGAYGILRIAPSGKNIAKFAVLADARIAMTRIVCAATMHLTDKGAYPADILALAPYFPDGLPKDPFTGENFIYSLKDGLPQIIAAAPKELTANAPESQFRLDFSTRPEREKEAMRDLAERRKEVRKKIGVE